jgi:hypothetical protein
LRLPPPKKCAFDIVPKLCKSLCYNPCGTRWKVKKLTHKVGVPNGITLKTLVVLNAVSGIWAFSLPFRLVPRKVNPFESQTKMEKSCVEGFCASIGACLQMCIFLPYTTKGRTIQGHK